MAALFALLLHAAALGASVSEHGGSPTATPRAPRYLGANGAWTFTTLEQSKPKQIVPPISVAPSDPRVLYKPTIDGTLAVQRSDDDGATWTIFRLPRGDVGDTRADVSVSVSPLDARTVFAIIDSNPSNPHCPPQTSQAFSPNAPHIGALALLLPRAGGYSCTFEYVSADGGATWQKPQTPEKGDVGGKSFPSPIQAQDGRLYSPLTPDINGPIDLGRRLLVSADSVHWQAADTQLVAQGLRVYEFVATPTGRTLFATTIPVNLAGDFTTQRQFWRSDDAGASWRNLGEFPNTRSDALDSWLSAAALVDGKALVYYTTTQPVPCGIITYQAVPCAYLPTIHVSADDGRTWQTSPHAGLPTGQVTPTRAAVGVLPDGRIVEGFVTLSFQATGPKSQTVLYSNPGLYGWKPGASSWSQLTPVISGDAIPRQTWLEQPTGARPAGVRMVISHYDACGSETKIGYCQLTQ
jgi:hypothetical protein